MDIRDTIPETISDIATTGLAIGIGDFKSGQVDIASTYRPDWQETYFANEWMMRDPVVMTGLTHLGVSEWPSLDQTDSRVLKAASDFGIRSGLVLATEISGNRCVAGLSTSQPVSAAARQEAIRALREMHFETLMARAHALTLAQKDLVFLFANGHLAKEVAEIMQISVHTVKQRKLFIQRHIGVNSFMAVVNVCACAGLTIHPIN